jgi:hypothetical protein
MTTLAEDLQAVLDPLFPGGSFYGVNTRQLDAQTVYPFAVFMAVTSTTNNTLLGATDLQNTRFQIDLFATRAHDLDTYGSALEAAMAAVNDSRALVNLMLTSQDQYEDQVRVFRRSFDFSIWSTK